MIMMTTTIMMVLKEAGKSGKQWMKRKATEEIPTTLLSFSTDIPFFDASTGYWEARVPMIMLKNGLVSLVID